MSDVAPVRASGGWSEAVQVQPYAMCKAERGSNCWYTGVLVLLPLLMMMLMLPRMAAVLMEFGSDAGACVW